MKAIFEQIASELSWEFEYGRTDFHNLRESVASDAINYLFVDPITRTPLYNDTGGLSGRQYSGKFMVLRNSDLDQDYDNMATGSGKYQLYISPLIDIIEVGQFHYELTCTHQLRINSLEIKEIVNVFSDNFDGVLVTYRFTNYELTS